MPEAANIIEFVRIGGILTSALVFVVTFAVVRVVNGFVLRLSQQFADRRLLIVQVGTFLRFGIYFIAIGLCIPLIFHLTDEMMLALGGTAAVTIGFALKDLTASLLAGITLLIDKPFQVGDRVTFGEHYGEITAIGLRSVRLITRDNKTVTIPNNKFLTDVVASSNAGANEMLIQMDFYIAADQPVATAKAIVQEAILTTQYAALSKRAVVRVSLYHFETQVTVRLRANVYVRDVRF